MADLNIAVCRAVDPHRITAARCLLGRVRKLLFQKRMIRCACFLTFEPLQVPRNPRVMAFTCKAPADIRPKKVIELLLGALPLHTRQPLSSLLMAVLAVCQLPQLLAGFGTGDKP